jgi:spore coat protein SA
LTTKLKVAIITPGSFPIPSPNSSSVETVVESLTAVLSKEVDFTIFGKKTKELHRKEKRGDITYIRFKKRYLNRVMEELQKVKYDIIQIENRPKFVSTIRQLFPDAQIWLSLHSTKYISNPHINREELFRELSFSDKIIVNSHFLKKYLTTKSNEHDYKIFVNHLGVDTMQFQSKWQSPPLRQVQEIKKMLNLGGHYHLLYVGRLRKMKGVEMLLKAIPKVVKKHPTIRLTIVGSAFYGSNRKTGYVNHLYQLAEGVSEHVKFVPFIPHNQIHFWFQAADIVIVPSIGKEAFGLVNIEAMACGNPIIATNIGGMPEIIQHGYTGFLINPEDAENQLAAFLDKLLSNPSLIKEMGENCVLNVLKHFTWERSAHRLLEQYLQIKS